MRLPDFVGIGFRRCSTSWLHACLNEHPSVGKTPRGIHYFSDNLDKGDNWYLQQFVPFTDREVIVDFSVSYSYPENVQKFAKHMPRLLPQAQVFAVVRNPVERAFSDYRLAIFQEEIEPDTTFEQALEMSPIILERGCYQNILQQILAVVPESSIRLFFYDDVKLRPDIFWQEICDFLGISSKFIPSVLHTRLNHLAPPKNPKVHSFLRQVNQVIAILPGVGQYWQLVKRTALWRKILAMDIKETGEVAPVARRNLLDFYAQDIDFLARFTGRDFSGWLK